MRVHVICLWCILSHVFYKDVIIIVFCVKINNNNNNFIQTQYYYYNIGYRCFKFSHVKTNFVIGTPISLCWLIICLIRQTRKNDMILYYVNNIKITLNATSGFNLC